MEFKNESSEMELLDDDGYLDLMNIPQSAISQFNLEDCDTSLLGIHEGSGNQLPSLLYNDAYLNIPTSTTIYNPCTQEMPPRDVPSEQFQGPFEGPLSNTTPATLPNNWAGIYGFNIACHPPENLTKNAAWTYSEMRDKLFVLMDANCPINLHTNVAPPSGSTIRVTSAYMKPVYAMNAVMRCLTHLNPSDSTNRNHKAPDHLIRCESHEVSYTTDERSGQKMLTVPYMEPTSEGGNSSTYIFKFMCWSSCVGGMNRRQIEVTFSLFDFQGQCIGRRTVEVRVCACPGRDRKAEEKHYSRKQAEALKNEQSVNAEQEPPLVVDLKRGISMMKCQGVSAGPSSKKKKVQAENTEYIIRASSLEEYEFLLGVRNAARKLKNRSLPKKDTSEED